MRNSKQPNQRSGILPHLSASFLLWAPAEVGLQCYSLANGADSSAGIQDSCCALPPCCTCTNQLNMQHICSMGITAATLLHAFHWLAAELCTNCIHSPRGQTCHALPNKHEASTQD